MTRRHQTTERKPPPHTSGVVSIEKIRKDFRKDYPDAETGRASEDAGDKGCTR
jgi:hypothetical protein